MKAVILVIKVGKTDKENIVKNVNFIINHRNNKYPTKINLNDTNKLKFLIYKHCVYKHDNNKL